MSLLSFRRRSRRSELDMEFEIAPMLDMVFLLLLFFVVSTTFRGEPGIEVDLPRAASSSQDLPEITEIVVDSKGKVYFQGNTPADADLGDILTVAAAKSESKIIYVRADKETRHGRVVAIIDLARRAGFQEATVATAPVVE